MSLSKFLEEVRHNQLATIQNKKLEYALMSEIDACFVQIATTLTNPQDLLTPAMFARCHAAWRGACATGTAGQIAETFVLLRSALEYAAYGLFMNKTAGAADVWIDRNESPEAKAAMRFTFQLRNIRPVIATCDRKLAKVFDTLYEHAIEQGGHPNPHGVFSSAKVSPIPGGGEQHSHTHLHGDGPILEFGLKSLIETGICCLYILQHISAFTARFELLGVKARLNTLRRNSSRLVKQPDR